MHYDKYIMNANNVGENMKTRSSWGTKMKRENNFEKHFNTIWRNPEEVIDNYPYNIPWPPIFSKGDIEGYQGNTVQESVTADVLKADGEKMTEVVRKYVISRNIHETFGHSSA